MHSEEPGDGNNMNKRNVDDHGIVEVSILVVKRNGSRDVPKQVRREIHGEKRITEV